MAKQHRRLVHELCHLYHVGTVAAGVEPARFISLLRTEKTGWPECTLLEAAEQRRLEPAAAAAPGAAAQWPLCLYQVE